LGLAEGIPFLSIMTSTISVPILSLFHAQEILLNLRIRAIFILLLMICLKKACSKFSLLYLNPYLLEKTKSRTNSQGCLIFSLLYLSASPQNKSRLTSLLGMGIRRRAERWKQL
jgi:hypothetical protein